MSEFDILIRSERVITPAGIGPATVGIRGGRIESVTGHGAVQPARQHIDLGKVALLPGGVDLGTGVCVPGRSLEESYQRVGEAALSGGVTTVVASAAPARPPITCVDALRVHRRAATGLSVSVFFLGGVTQGTGPLELADLRAAGVVAFHCSLADGGAPDMAALGEAQLRKAMVELAALETVLLVHTEDARELGFPASAEQRPPRAERRGLERVVAAARLAGTRTHVSSFTAAECAALLTTAGSVGVNLTAQTCPHYLCLPAEALRPEVHGCRPPLRSEANRKALWNTFLSQETPITTIGSGHLPAHGMYTLERGLSALWTAASRRALGLAELSHWTSTAPAELVGLVGKGRICEGYDADLVAFDPESTVEVSETDPSPYAGRVLTGRVERVWVLGRERVLG